MEKLRRRAATPKNLEAGIILPNFYGSNRQAFEASEREVLISGPAGTGKSRTWLEKMHWAAQVYPNMRGLIVRKSRTSLSETGLQTFEDHVLGRDHPMLADGPQRRNRQVYSYPNGSEIVVGGMDKSERILSSEYDLIYPQEAIELTITDWEDLTTRLRNGVMPYQQIGADTNPSHPQHWLKQRCDSGATRLLYGKHEDNPRLYDHDKGAFNEFGVQYIATLDALTGIRRKRKRFGLWVQAEGAVYEDWDESIHLIDRFDIPADWPRYRSIDFGYTNPFVCQWWAVDPDGRLYLYREIYMTRRTVKVHAAQINRLSEREIIHGTVADHDAEDRATLSENGIDTMAAKKSLSTGIEKVQERLKVAGDGKPRLFYLRDSLVEVDTDLLEKQWPTCSLDEKTAYQYPEGKDGRPVKEVPVDLWNHGQDAERYMVMALEHLPTEGFSFDLPWGI